MAINTINIGDEMYDKSTSNAQRHFDKCSIYKCRWNSKSCPVKIAEEYRRINNINKKSTLSSSIKNHTGSKYIRTIHSCIKGQPSIKVDVYEVLIAFDVTSPPLQHGLKKLLCTGIRGKNSRLQDLIEARDAIQREIDIEERNGQNKGLNKAS